MELLLCFCHNIHYLYFIQKKKYTMSEFGKHVSQWVLFFIGFYALFTEPISTFFNKNNFNIGIYSTIHTFKNYFATMFSVFSNKRYSNKPYACVWIALKRKVDVQLRFFCGSCALFTEPANTDFSKFFFKTRSHGTIHTFIIYFATVFLIFSNKRYSNRPYVSLGLELWIISLTMPQPRGTN